MNPRFTEAELDGALEPVRHRFQALEREDQALRQELQAHKPRAA
jgi:hypothetical protein